MAKISIKKLPTVIVPDKCIIEDFEILSFDNEEGLDLFSIWNDKRRDGGASEQQQLQEQQRQPQQTPKIKKPKPSSSSSSAHQHHGSQANVLREETSLNTTALSESTNQQQASNTSSAATPDLLTPRPLPAAKKTARNLSALQSRLSGLSRTLQAAVPLQPANRLPLPGTATLPNGLTILNSSYYNTLPSGKQMMKYKLTKLYNKYRGRQMRRNFVNDKNRAAKIEAEVSRSYLNSWLAYTALQALRLPDNNMNQLSTVTNNNTKFILPSSLQTQAPATSTPKKSSKVKDGKRQQSLNNSNQSPGSPATGPMHLVYIDSGNLITYSNKINPQQVAKYRQKSHLLPSSATSKKSSAASYDVYEIMEVLANTNKSNVTITRNANRPAQPGQSVYSHSVNANTTGIVSTQLHLQARSYLDSMSKFYLEEHQRLEKERAELDREPSVDEILSRYLKLDERHKSNLNQNNSQSAQDKMNDGSSADDELEKLEEDIKSLINPQSNSNNTASGLDNSNMYIDPVV